MDSSSELLAKNLIPRLTIPNSKIFPLQSTDAFHETVQKHLSEQLSGLDPEAVLGVKKLLRATLRDRGDPDAVNLRESYGSFGSL